MINLNDPPVVGPDGKLPTQADVSAAIAKVAGPELPVMGSPPASTYELPCGLLGPDGKLVKDVTVRELNGYDEEKLARLDANTNVANYVTELCLAAVTSLGPEPPTRDQIRSLLIGDRDYLVMAIRRTTYGNMVEFELSCDACETKSAIEIDLTEDVKVIEMSDPYTRSFEMEISHSGRVKIELLNGFAQEAFSENTKKVKTQAEINTLMLAKSVSEINGKPTFGTEDPVRNLPSGDRAKILDFISEIQPGPQLQEPVPVPCATCGKEYPISLGLSNMFRF